MSMSNGSFYPIFQDMRGKKHDEWVALINDLGALDVEFGRWPRDI